LCSAGHPPPLLRAGGEARILDLTTGPPVGHPWGPRTPTSLTMGPGDALLLYTDGLVETREATLDQRLEQLRAATREAPEQPARLLDRILDEMLAPTMPDDVAVLAVRRLTG
jgi:serine phosphatase RsbU (regulator of sigma subunit)